MKIVISGGHLTPALAFIDYVKKNHPDNEIVFIGRTHTQNKTKQVSREKRETTKKGARFISFSSTKLSRNNIFEKIKAVPILLGSTIKSIFILGKAKPDVFISFGGYLAVPITLASWIMRIPIITHEQTRTAGIANKLIAKFADRIAISYEDSFKYFPKGRTILTGNLIRENILAENHQRPSWIEKNPKQPIIYITGGSQGSEIINQTIAQVIKPLTKDWTIIHQCGNATKTRNYKKELLSIKNTLPSAGKDNYYVKEWLSEADLSWVYSNIKIIISRAGANTTEEIARKKIPSILIPLPFSHNDEQLKNAQALSNKNQAILLEQKFLNPKSLLESINLVNKYHRKFSRNLEMFVQSQNSEEKLYDLVKIVIK
ncbi:UDP-N-acetylglucosamine--N-acetylmuramyl-(pentapeptide) pyrophosphoryl-undecaprenol N-acetylglucosamine transferase [Candidatus Woesebacteria bacterium]|nr:UDP-N-acetylglucosamine--N-acetylmuramyl-(pentapeptide) pyrophosphoryl-undecaprenol N-acetylglucosamine transferase [Candidatus Woesebacteria bacterium]